MHCRSLPFPFAVLILLVACGPGEPEPPAWTAADARAHAAQQADSSLWDRNMLADDLAFKPLLDSLAFPIATGAWPVAAYGTPGNGSTLVEFTTAGQRVVGRALHVGRGPHNDRIFPDSLQRSEVVAVIMVRTETPDDEHRSIAISRNHPHYLAEGRFTTSAGDVDWLTMLTADRNAYAVVNMKLFDLRAGGVVLVAPQSDGSLRFQQRDMPLLAQDEVEDFVALMAQEAEVQAFFR